MQKQNEVTGNMTWSEMISVGANTIGPILAGH